MFKKKNAQSIVVSAVDNRGYFSKKDGTPYSLDELAVRQGLKLIEELSEMVHDLAGRPFWAEGLRASADVARVLFDEGETSPVVDRASAVNELADVMVVAFCLAHALGEDDIVARAVEKATRDIKRGVRGS